MRFGTYCIYSADHGGVVEGREKALRPLVRRRHEEGLQVAGDELRRVVHRLLQDPRHLRRYNLEEDWAALG